MKGRGIYGACDYLESDGRSKPQEDGWSFTVVRVMVALLPERMMSRGGRGVGG